MDSLRILFTVEKLVIDQLDGVVTVPARLEFECSDRSTLLDQLKVLQMVLRKERDKGRGGTNTSMQMDTETDNKDSIKNIPQFRNSIPKDLQDKIDKNKRLAVKRREAKLRDMDENAQSISSPSSSRDSASSSAESKKNSDNVSNETWGKLADRIKRQKLESKDDQSMTKSTLNHSNESSKRFKTEKNHDKEQDLMTAYASSSTSASRDEIRLKVIEKIRNSGIKMSIVEPGEFALKYALSAPYHMFLTRVEDSKETYDQQFSLTFPEILDRSLGEITSSLQINFMLDAGWLCAQYLLAGQSSDMLILYGEREDQEKLPHNIKTHHIKMPTFGCHHAKLMVLKYKNDGIRVVVSTANLYSDDWENRTQG